MAKTKLLLAAKEKLVKKFLMPVSVVRIRSIDHTGRFEAHTAGLENIVGIGIGANVISVYVISNNDLKQIRGLVSKEIGDIPTVVVETGKVCCFYPTYPGVSVGRFNTPIRGTLGAVVGDYNNKFYILSNNHVLANCNAAQIGDSILQPSLLDGGNNPYNEIAKLSEFVQIDFAPNAKKSC